MSTHYTYHHQYMVSKSLNSHIKVKHQRPTPN